MILDMDYSTTIEEGWDSKITLDVAKVVTDMKSKNLHSLPVSIISVISDKLGLQLPIR